MINEIGIEEIRTFLIKNHKDGAYYFSSDRVTELALSAWADDADSSLAAGGDAIIELKQRDSVSGRTQTYTISAAGIDT